VENKKESYSASSRGGEELTLVALSFVYFGSQNDNQGCHFCLKNTPLNSPTRLQASEFGRAYRVHCEPVDPAPKPSLLTIQLGHWSWER